MANKENFSTIINRYFKNDYHERGKIKWNGFFLSDHTSSLVKEDVQRYQKPQKLPRITLNEAQHILQHSCVNYHIVTVQQNIETTDGHLIPNVTGLVNGFTALGVYINQQFIAFEDIRTVIREK
ncbi:hypothetical protein JK161_03660 [Leuconostoc mesenteroides]|uniref:hypothetical protein n=1 Tax=Leuconostoc mesenteroides TaxID=1245 RepID=UPI001B8CB981|nr:hypothetical protein [Leuconostoc mesenteroides]MBS0941946.1 hypothetical protein [Leuconostoc mesenteroides]